MVEIGSEASLLLDRGEYTITLMAFDGQGNFGEATVTISVLAAKHGIYLPAILK